MTNEQLDQIYHEGYNAAWASVPRWENPGQSDDSRGAWDEGYVAGIKAIFKRHTERKDREYDVSN